MSDEEIEVAVPSDSDCPPATEEQLARAAAGRKLRLLRTKLGLSQEEFARRYWSRMDGPAARNLVLDPGSALRCAQLVRDDGILYSRKSFTASIASTSPIRCNFIPAEYAVVNLVIR